MEFNFTDSVRRSGVKVQPEDDRKIVAGYEKHLTEVKMAKRHLTDY